MGLYNYNPNLTPAQQVSEPYRADMSFMNNTQPYTMPIVDVPMTASQQQSSGLWDMLGSGSNWNAAGNLMSGLGSLGNIWLGYKAYEIAKDQLGIQKGLYDMTHERYNHLKDTRNRLTKAYMA